MGRVLSFSDIRSERLPIVPETFDIAREMMCEGIERGIQQEYFDGGAIFGSVASGTPNVRSDLDSMIVLTEHPDAYDAVQELIFSIQDETGNRLPIGPATHRRSFLESADSEIDRFFGKHIVSIDRKVIGNDPADYMRHHTLPAKDILALYLYHKKRRMSNTYTTVRPLEVNEGGLQRMLELPTALGRKAIQSLHEVGYPIAPMDRSADKQMVLERSREFFAANGLVDGFDALVQANQEYNQILYGAINGDIDEALYNCELQALHGQLKTAIGWTEDMIIKLLPLFKEYEFTSSP